MVDTCFLSQGLTTLAGLLLLPFGSLAASQIEDQAEQFFRSGHTNNWAVLVCTSRFWFNYRHVANTLSVYRSVKRLGIPDSYNELLFIIDTCQGASMYERFYSPNIMALASSQVGEDSLSHQPDPAVGVHLMDRYTFYVLEFLEEINPASQTNMNDLFQVCPKSLCVSTPGHRTDLFQRDPKNVLITDFFGSVRKVEITTETLSLQPDSGVMESSYKKDQMVEELMEPLKYAEQLPVAQIIHQKPKLKDWHPPGGFILGLWALIIMVFFKTYGIKHMKFIF
uniref:GPI-anchor transamidase n=1 Tax=Capra hircus TaxID=9925 RepID=A0A8C2NW74_CAPHI